MDTNCVNTLISAAQQYKSYTSEANLIQLQRQLDVFIQVSSKTVPASVRDQSQLSTVDLFSCLIDLINDSPNRGFQPSLAQKAMVVLHNLASDHSVSEALHEKYHVTALLLSYVRKHASSASDPGTLMCVKLLQKTTYRHKMSSQENYTDDLLDFLVSQIMAVQSELTEPCYSVLANICSDNFSLQNQLMNRKNTKPFVKKLIHNLSNSSHLVTVFSLCILHSCYSAHELTKFVFNAKNINQTFMLMFNILLNDHDVAVRTAIVDLFVIMLRDYNIQQALSIYAHLESCTKQVLSLICSKKKDASRIIKIFELLLSFCKVNRLRCVVCKTLLESPTLKDPIQYKQLLTQCHVTEPFFALVHWATQSVQSHQDAPLLALEFLHEIYEEMLTQGVGTDMSPRTDLTLPMVTDILQSPQQPDDVLLDKRCAKQVRALQILNTLCSDSGQKLQVARAVNSQMCASLVRFQLSHNSLNHLNEHSGHEDWRDVGIDVVLKTLDVMICLQDLVSDMKETLCQLLQESQVTSFLAQGMTSTSRDRVQTTLTILKLASEMSEFPTISLGDSIVSLNNKKTAANEVKELNSMPMSQHTHVLGNHWHDNKENIHQNKGPLNSLSSTRSTSSSGIGEDLEKSVDLLVEKLHTGLEVKDLRTSEVLSVYQAKLQSLQTKESHAEDLLEAKTLALEQADRLLAQYRCTRVKAEAELNMLRSQLSNSDRSCEALKEQVNELMLSKESLSNDIEELVQDNIRLEQTANKCVELQEAYTEQGYRLESAKKSIEALKAEHTTMAEMQEMLKRHNETLKQQHDVASQQLQESEEERKIISKQLKDRDAKLSECSKSMKRTDERLRKLENDREELEVAIDGLRDELSKSEEKKKRLGHEVKTLELLVCEHEKNLKEKDAAIGKFRAELDKHAEVAALIHKLSGN